MKKILRRAGFLGAGLTLLVLAGCFSKTVKETTSTPSVIAAPAEPATSQTTTTTTTSSDGSVERQSTTTYSNP